MRRSPAPGFSLLEVLSALALLSLLLLGVFYGIRTATRSVNTGSAVLERNDQARSLQQFLRRDLLQARALPWKLDAKGQGVVFEGEPRRMRFVAPLPGYLDRTGPQLQTLTLVDAGKGRWRLELGSTQLSPGGAGVDVGNEVLAGDMSDGRFRYYGREREGLEPRWSDRWNASARMPELVTIELDRGPRAHDAGARSANDDREDGMAWLWLQAPIRQSPNAINVGALAKALPEGSSP
ncbi:prepilin-type N-terminal cleavage/methylation domain-containing protein [Dyella sp. BiH032]|uniref:prepilin-type N-terminal cleavage/methylation domain-containing protein n=1 Tax=Dyella sp. BiH032 TaxID=3075430 RepID=UPI00289319C1|nr:prepilin-type N-terminal cleavage/methylation domain-containing protein [Dyella sp. BiH032]WNL44451.1 prepilin-type N-terminal cleavage/methylation domain-containing protein [Dyella sp. BiH032]